MRLASPLRSSALACLVALVGGVLAMRAAPAGSLSPAQIYGVGVDNTIYYVDTTVKNIQAVTPSLSTGVKANGFATDRDQNHLYYFGSNGDLYFYDIVNGDAGTVAPASTFGNSADFPPENAGFSNGSFWYIGKGDDYDNKLYQVAITYSGTANVPSFSGTPVAYQLSASGSTTGMAFGDIAINPTSGTLYGSTTPGSGGLFFSLDLATLSPSGTTPVNVIASGKPISLQLAFSDDYATLYGQQYIFDPTDPTNPAKTSGAWFTVDTTTGSYDAISGFTTTPGMRDLAGVAAVPEPGTFLLATVGFAAALAWNRRPLVKVARAS